jgi:hypothetical protein
MSVINSDGKHGLHPIAKWSLIVAPILWIVGGLMMTGGAFGEYGAKWVQTIAAEGDTAKLGIMLSVAAGLLFVRSVAGISQIAPEAAVNRMRLATIGGAIAVASWTPLLGIGLAVADGADIIAVAAPIMIGMQNASNLVFMMALIPLGGGLALAGLFPQARIIGLVVFIIAIVGIVTTFVLGANDETGALIFALIQFILAIIFLAIGVMMFSSGSDD